MDGTEPYKFIGFGAMDGSKPYEFIGFGAVDFLKKASSTRSYKGCRVARKTDVVLKTSRSLRFGSTEEVG